MADNNPDSHASSAPRPDDIRGTPTASEAFYQAKAPTVRRGEGAPIASTALPERIGRYRIIGPIGEGGMGMVLEAEQDKPRRIVALKVIRPGVASLPMLARFEHESEMLGLLQHPGIAQVYEAGTFDIGGGTQPYFAMEFIRGQPLTTYVREKNLGTRERLRLMIKVCEAVQHAHQKGVIHRDLKPSNILVDDSGQPKILDFGVARLTASDIHSTTLRTDIGQLIGTIPYMSPEQTEGDPRKLDTRSDVYALGVVCYELISDRLPYDLQQNMIHEAVRIIREDDPTPLSSVNRVFRGDVETIVGKALEKDRDRRYQSASELAADFERYLRDEPIVARPTTQWYRVKKFARRNKVLVGGVAATIVVLAAGLIATLILLQQVNIARNAERQQTQIAKDNSDKAAKAEKAEKQRADELEKVAAFQSSMLSQIDLEAMGWQILDEQRRQVESGLRRIWTDGDDGKVRQQTDEEVAEALARYSEAVSPGNPTDIARQLVHDSILKPALQAIERDFSNLAPIEAMLRDTIGTVYWNLGMFPAAEPQFSKSLEIRRRTYTPPHRLIAQSLNNQALLLQDEGKYDSGELLFQEALATVPSESERDRLQRSDVLENYGMLLADKADFATAERLLREALEVRQEYLGDKHETVGSCLHNLATVLQSRGDYPAAEEFYRQALDMRRQVFGDKSLETASDMANLASLLKTKGSFDDAEHLYRQALSARRELLGNQHPEVARNADDLATVLAAKGKWDEAESLLAEAFETRRQLLGPKHIDLTRSIENMALLLESKGDYPRAEPLFRQNVSLRLTLLGEDHPNYATSLVNLAAFLAKAKAQFREADLLLTKALAIYRKSLGSVHDAVARTLNLKASVLQDSDNLSDAESCYQESLIINRTLHGNDNVNVADVLHNLATLRFDKGDFDAAIGYGREALDIHERVFGQDHPSVATILDNLASMMKRKGDYDGAEAMYRRALTIFRRAYGDAHPEVATNLNNLASLLHQRKDYAAAEPLNREALGIRQGLFPVGHPAIAASQARLGVSLFNLGRFEEAEGLLTEAQKCLSTSPGVRSVEIHSVHLALIRMYEAWSATEPDKGYDVKATEWKAKLAELQSATQSAATQTATSRPSDSQPATSRADP